jgi:hypothetical protein
MKARIFRPGKPATQSGRAKSHRWQLEFEPEAPQTIEPLMGYTSATDMKREIKLSFATLDEAVGYAKRHGVQFEIIEGGERVVRPSAYADNFSFARPDPWTH